MNLTVREVIQQGYGAIGANSTTLREKIEDVAAFIDVRGYGEKVTTGQIKRQLIRSGRA